MASKVDLWPSEGYQVLAHPGTIMAFTFAITSVDCEHGLLDCI